MSAKVDLAKINQLFWGFRRFLGAFAFKTQLQEFPAAAQEIPAAAAL